MKDINNMEKTPNIYTSEIIQSELGVSANSLTSLGMSIGGSVMKVETERGDFVVKLIANQPLEPIKDEDVSERVYGGRWTEFDAAYEAMQSGDVPLPSVHKTGYTSDNKYYFIVMDYVPGESVREYMAEASEDNELHRTIGETFGKLHAITRDYQGWVSMENSYESRWGEAFFSAFDNQLQEIADGQYLSTDTIEQLKSLIATYQDDWIGTSEYVLSHLDGFQGIAERQGEGWRMNGIIDIEDHQFTDQRFVLCGHELAMETEGSTLPQTFWDGYVANKSIDPTFDKYKQLFKLYYLSVWLCVFNDENIGDIPDREEKAKKMQQMIISILINS